MRLTTGCQPLANDRSPYLPLTQDFAEWLPDGWLSSPDQRAYQNFPRVQARAFPSALVLRRYLFLRACSPSRSGPQQPIDSANRLQVFRPARGWRGGHGQPFDHLPGARVTSLPPCWNELVWRELTACIRFPGAPRTPPQQRGCAASSCRMASSLLTNSSASAAEKTRVGRSLSRL